MYQFLKHAHSGWRYIILLLAAVLMVKIIAGIATKGKWKTWDNRLRLFYTIALDIQVLLGLFMYVQLKWWSIGDPVRAYEHPFIMIVAVAFAHIAKKRIVKASDEAKFKQALIWLGTSVLLVAVGVWRVTSATTG